MMDKLARYGFLISILVTAIVVYLYDRQGKRFATTLFNLQKEAIEDKLAKAKERLKTDEKDFATNLIKYEKLKRLLAADIKRTGAEH